MSSAADTSRHSCSSSGRNQASRCRKTRWRPARHERRSTQTRENVACTNDGRDDRIGRRSGGGCRVRAGVKGSMIRQQYRITDELHTHIVCDSPAQLERLRRRCDRERSNTLPAAVRPAPSRVAGRCPVAVSRLRRARPPGSPSFGIRGRALRFDAGRCRKVEGPLSTPGCSLESRTRPEGPVNVPPTRSRVRSLRFTAARAIGWPVGSVTVPIRSGIRCCAMSSGGGGGGCCGAACAGRSRRQQARGTRQRGDD